MSSPKPLYRIRNWAEVFERAQTRKQPREMSWVPMPTRMDGKRYRKIATHERGAEILGCWMAMVEIAAQRPMDRRGYLEDSDGPLGSEDLSVISGIKKESFDFAINILSMKGIEWLVSESMVEHYQSTTSALETFGLQNRTEQERTEQERETAPAPPARPLSLQEWGKPDVDEVAQRTASDLIPLHWFPSDQRLSIVNLRLELATAADPDAHGAAIRLSHERWRDQVNQARLSSSLPRAIANKAFEWWIKDRMYLQEPRFGTTRLEQAATSTRPGVSRTVARLLADGKGKNG